MCRPVPLRLPTDNRLTFRRLRRRWLILWGAKHKFVLVTASDLPRISQKWGVQNATVFIIAVHEDLLIIVIFNSSSRGQISRLLWMINQICIDDGRVWRTSLDGIWLSYAICILTCDWWWSKSRGGVLEQIWLRQDHCWLPRGGGDHGGCTWSLESHLQWVRPQCQRFKHPTVIIEPDMAGWARDGWRFAKLVARPLRNSQLQYNIIGTAVQICQ